MPLSYKHPGIFFTKLTCKTKYHDQRNCFNKFPYHLAYRLQVVPHLSSGIVERAKRERLSKIVCLRLFFIKSKANNWSYKNARVI